MIDGKKRLLGSRVHVWGEGAEWWTETRQCIFPFLLSAARCSPAVTAALLASATTRKYQPHLLSWLLLWLHIFPCSNFFYEAGGVISGCVKMSEHICWSKNLQTQHVSWIVSQQLFLLGKQSSPKPKFVCPTPLDRLHQSNGVTVYRVHTSFFL